MDEEPAADWKRYSVLDDNVAFFRLMWVGAFSLLIVSLYSNAASIKGSFFPPAFANVTGQIDNIEARYSSHKGGSSYCSFVSYSYHVKGTKYQNDLISFVGYGPCARTQSEALALVEGYKIGSPVLVYYDPSDPAFSVLMPNETMQGFVKWSNPAYLFFAVLFISATHFCKKKRQQFKVEMGQKHGFKW